MYRLSENSLKKLETCDARLQQVVIRAMSKQIIDFGVSHGWRGERLQNTLFAANKSEKGWPDSKHNNLDVLGEPNSLAVDLYPFIRVQGKGFVPWTEARYWYFLAGVMYAAAEEVGVKLRWGGDWDGDTFFGDQTFDDLGHFELQRE